MEANDNTEGSESPILFHNKDISYELDNTSEIISWILACIDDEKTSLNFVNFIFCSDSYLHTINLEYLNHDTLTDIITFPYSDETIEADIFISIERVKENAKLFEVSFKNELHRVIIHGILHLLGYADKSELEKNKMRAKEDFYLNKLTI